MIAKGPEPGLSLEALEAFIDAPASGQEDPSPIVAGVAKASRGQSSALTALLDVAAVLAVFDPFALKPLGSLSNSERDQAIQPLIAASETLATTTEQRRLWTMKLSDRRAALRRLGTRERMQQALAANSPASPSVLQRAFEKLLSGNAPPLLVDTPRDEIAALITARSWLEGILSDLPELSDLHGALAQAEVFAPLHRLVSDGFFGRVEQLQRLQVFFGEGTEIKSPMFIYGSGGSGKSTLLARSILDQAGVRCAYVDIDRPNVRPEAPLTFLLEIVRQLSAQLGSSDFRGLETHIIDDLAKGEVGRHLESMASFRGWDNHIAEFGQLVEGLGVARIIVGIDTFEEAQFLGDDVVEPALDFIFRLGELAGALRIVVAGRVLPRPFLERLHLSYSEMTPEMDVDEIAAKLPASQRPIGLGDLTDTDARTLLRSFISAGDAASLTDLEAAEVISIVGRNPMSLRLAARILKQGGLARLRENSSELLLELKAEKTQAMLYGRILHHLHRADVAKVAYPGLVVRRITPDVVRKVLAVPCGLTLTQERNEFAIWQDLAKEVALVHLDRRDYSLRHRTDVRRIMLQDLVDHVAPETIAAIDAAAVAYYFEQSGAAARAEEIYHRLRLAEPLAAVEARWLPDAAPYLKDALEDFALARPKVWLANKLGVTLETSLRHQADLEEWEQQSARAVDRYLASGSPDAALSLIRERADRSRRSPLYALEAETLRFLGRLDESLAVARKGVEALSRAGATDAAAELLLKMAAIEEGRQNFHAARTLLQNVQPIAKLSRDPLLYLHALTSWLRVDRQIDPGNHEARNRQREQAAALLTDDVLYRLRRQPVLLRELAAELSAVDGRLAGQAIQTLGFELATDRQVKLFADALAQLTANAASELNPDIKAVAARADQHEQNPEQLRRSIENLSEDSFRQVVREIGAADRDALKSVREYFRSSVQSIQNKTSGF